MHNPHSPRSTLAALACALAVAGTLVAPPAVLAAGSPTIAGAPVAQPGVQYFGNTATDPYTEGRRCSDPGGNLGTGRPNEYWALNLTAGDQVVITGQDTPPASGSWVCAYPPGTNDANFEAAQNVERQQLSEGLRFTANATGLWPLALSVCTGCWVGGGKLGPFSFTVTIYHKALLFAPSHVHIPVGGRFIAYARAPDGSEIADNGLALKLYGIWRDRPYLPATKHLLASAPVSAGRAAFLYRLPRSLAHHKLRLLISGEGSSYQPITSVSTMAYVSGTSHPRYRAGHHRSRRARRK